MKAQLLLLTLLYALTSCGKEKKIPLDARNWYQLNSISAKEDTLTGLKQLCDGILDKSVMMGKGKILSDYDCYYEFRNAENVRINKIRFYDGEGSFPNAPFRLYAKETASAKPVLLAMFTGEAYMKWSEIILPSAVKAKYLIANIKGGLPNEIELYGECDDAKPLKLFAKKEAPFSQQLGINSFIWNIMQDSKKADNKNAIIDQRLQLFRTFSQIRDYVDWGKIEPEEGSYTFNPTQNGLWYYDVLYREMKNQKMDVLLCLKTLPQWFLEKYYPENKRNAENIPAPAQADLLDPKSYILQAKTAFQLAARYGYNKKVPAALLAGVAIGKVWAGDAKSPVRTNEAGQEVLKYIECENERDKWWKGRSAYQTAREYAANLSAFYDGHKNTMGPGVGVKNADPSMQVVMGGMASTQTDYLRGIIDWCKEFRGYKSDGSVDLCFDVINYHCYYNEGGGSQSKSSLQGASPEAFAGGEIAERFVQIAREYNKEVWVTETGYDINEHSPLHAPSIADKTPERVQADWIIRTALSNARHGISRTFFYEAYSENVNSWKQFGSSGLLNDKDLIRSGAADYILQAKQLLGDYKYKETLSEKPLVDKYVMKDKAILVLLSPTQNNTMQNYKLSLKGFTKAALHTLSIGSNKTSVEIKNVLNGTLIVPVSETPIFVEGL